MRRVQSQPPGVWLSIQRRSRGGVSGEGRSGEGVHDDVDPERLDRRKNGLLGGSDGGYEYEDHGGDARRDLESKDLIGVVDTPAPHDSLWHR